MSVIYRSIITSKFRTENLLSFYNAVGDSDSQYSIYAGFGRAEPWADNETDPKFAPPYPNDSIEGQADSWNRLIGITKIPQSQLRPVYPRDDWGDIRYENPEIFKIGDIMVTNSAPYNLTERGTGWMVYQCVDVPEAGQCSITSLLTKKDCLNVGGEWTPSHNALIPFGRSDGVDMQDGYIWEYLYTIPPDVAINECTNEYIVIPTPQELIDNPARWGYEDVLKWYPDRYDLIYRMRCNTLRFRAYFDSTFFQAASMIGNTGFRQMCIMVNPMEKKDHPSDGDVKCRSDNYLKSELDLHSGEIIYMENRQPIIRSRDQTEELNVVFQF